MVFSFRYATVCSENPRNPRKSFMKAKEKLVWRLTLKYNLKKAKITIKMSVTV
jgi:hypothetical protein